MKLKCQCYNLFSESILLDTFIRENIAYRETFSTEITVLHSCIYMYMYNVDACQHIPSLHTYMFWMYNVSIENRRVFANLAFWETPIEVSSRRIIFTYQILHNGNSRIYPRGNSLPY